MTDGGDERIWQVRAVVYQHLATTGRPPSIEFIASRQGISAIDAQEMLEQLHERHALLLDPTTRTIRIANPFSGIPTPFRVETRNTTYWANCAWDALGIPAALHADARIQASCADSNVPIRLTVESGNIHGDDAIVHFAVPVRDWYDNLIHT